MWEDESIEGDLLCFKCKDTDFILQPYQDNRTRLQGWILTCNICGKTSIIPYEYKLILKKGKKGNKREFSKGFYSLGVSFLLVLLVIAMGTSIILLIMVIAGGCG